MFSVATSNVMNRSTISEHLVKIPKCRKSYNETNTKY